MYINANFIVHNQEVLENVGGGSSSRAVLDGKSSKRCDVCALDGSLYILQITYSQELTMMFNKFIEHSNINITHFTRHKEMFVKQIKYGSECVQE